MLTRAVEYKMFDSASKKVYERLAMKPLEI